MVGIRPESSVIYATHLRNPYPHISHSHSHLHSTSLRRNTAKKTSSFGEMRKSSSKRRHKWRTWVHVLTHVHTLWSHTCVHNCIPLMCSIVISKTTTRIFMSTAKTLYSNFIHAAINFSGSSICVFSVRPPLRVPWIVQIKKQGSVRHCML